ncbi:deoxycytidylate deaminase [Salvelinus sp. IW2-2015]|uniref:deoxycytidylate deaminase n=1 Tax=Salvelinus sp. IW2-2015 TaxID=2691554 RepID=UPI0038D37B2C
MSQEIKNETSQLNGTPSSDPAQTKKREDYLEWPEYFMAVAFLSAQRSKDPSSQVNALARTPLFDTAGQDGGGYLIEFPEFPAVWRAPESIAGINVGGLFEGKYCKYPYVCHAELNAIMNKNSADVKGCSMYVALFPCNECAKLIIQAGIKDVIYLSDKYHDIPEMTASRRLLNLAGIQYKQFKPKRNKFVIDFNSINSGMFNGTG